MPAIEFPGTNQEIDTDRPMTSVVAIVMVTVLISIILGAVTVARRIVNKGKQQAEIQIERVS